MKVIICEDYDELSREAFKIIKDALDKKPNLVLGLATGSSPIGLYKEMIKDHEVNKTSYKDVVSYNLDEYVGIDENHSQSYRTFMNENLFNGIDIDINNTHVPKGDTLEDALAYEKSLPQIDIQVLGIGKNGHIGFNEPNTPADSLTHIVDLTMNTREANARFFDDDVTKVPKAAITMGIGTIMRSKKIILVANGLGKSEAVKAMIEGKVTPSVPASILQKHDDVTIILDKDAASLLEKEY